MPRGIVPIITLLDLKTVGVKGDERSYESIAVLAGSGEFDK
jgi:GMP synthase PP-ATPase subunit